MPTTKKSVYLVVNCTIYFTLFQVLEVYDCAREELQIGPFTYEPMRAVDIWLQQTDEFLLQVESITQSRKYVFRAPTN